MGKRINKIYLNQQTNSFLIKYILRKRSIMFSRVITCTELSNSPENLCVGVVYQYNHTTYITISTRIHILTKQKKGKGRYYLKTIQQLSSRTLQRTGRRFVVGNCRIRCSFNLVISCVTGARAHLSQDRTTCQCPCLYLNMAMPRISPTDYLSPFFTFIQIEYPNSQTFGPRSKVSAVTSHFTSSHFRLSTQNFRHSFSAFQIQKSFSIKFL